MLLFALQLRGRLHCLHSRLVQCRRVLCMLSHPACSVQCSYLSWFAAVSWAFCRKLCKLLFNTGVGLASCCWQAPRRCCSTPCPTVCKKPRMQQQSAAWRLSSQEGSGIRVLHCGIILFRGLCEHGMVSSQTFSKTFFCCLMHAVVHTQHLTMHVQALIQQCRMCVPTLVIPFIGRLS
jgi:hypothetical protein